MRFLSAMALGCLAAGDAVAGAWTLAEGTGQVIMTASRKMAPVSAFAGGATRDDTNASQIFVEYGLLDGLTVGATVYGEFSAVDAQDLELRVGGHVRHRLWTGQAGDVVSVQVGYSAPVERWLGNGLGDDLPNSVPEGHLRLLYGRGWQTDWGNSFVSAEGGLHIRSENQDDELRFDITAGHQPTKRLLGLMSLFTTMPLGDRGEAALKLSPSVAYTLWPWVGENDKKPDGPLYPSTIQLGVVWDALNPDDGLGVAVSVWKPF